MSWLRNLFRRGDNGGPRKAPIVLTNVNLAKLATQRPAADNSQEISVDTAGLSSAGGSIRIPRTAYDYGSMFGEEITDVDREYAAEREPIGHFLVYRMAKDIYKNWFRIDDPGTEDPDPDLDKAIQERLNEINAQAELIKALEWERKYGKAYIVGRFNDANTNQELRSELSETAELLEIYAYPRTKVEVTTKEEDENSERFDDPIIYTIARTDSLKIEVHYSRVIEYKTRDRGDLSWSTGSVIDPVYDDLSSLRNIRWGLAQTIWRVGTGFPVFEISDFTVEQLIALKDSGQLANLMSRSMILINDRMKFNLEGAQGSALDPGPYYEPILEAISAGSGVPLPILRGVVAGKVTGAEVNERSYWDVIATNQEDNNPVVSEVIEWSFHNNRTEIPETFKIEWLPGFEESAEDEARAAMFEERANETRLNYMTVNEVRALNEIEGEVEGGEQVLGLLKVQQRQLFQQPIEPGGE